MLLTQYLPRVSPPSYLVSCVELSLRLDLDNNTDFCSDMPKAALASIWKRSADQVKKLRDAWSFLFKCLVLLATFCLCFHAIMSNVSHLAPHARLFLVLFSIVSLIDLGSECLLVLAAFACACMP